MTVIVVGLGSMGKRRIRLMQQKYPNIVIGGIDLDSDRRVQAEKMFGIRSFTSIEESITALSPEAGFVCTSPLSHYLIIEKLLNFGVHVFTEVNLVNNGYEEMVALANKRHLVLFLSSTFLYRKDIQYIKRKVSRQRVNYVYHVGQYLPDWHPWESYKNFFVGDKRSNGCREIFAIDLPWIVKSFGEVERFSVVKDRLSNLEIDYDDNYILTLQHKNGSKGVILADIVSRKGGRRLEVFSEELHLFWEGTPDSLFEYDFESKINRQVSTYEKIDRQAMYNDSIIENAYCDEIVYFFQEIKGDCVSLYSFEADRKILELIDEIES